VKAILISKLQSYYLVKMSRMQKKNLDSSPDETRTFEKGKVELVNFDNVTIGRAVLEPGWSWEKCVKPLVKTNSCQQPHTQYMISGRMKVVMDDGVEEEFGPGDALVVPPGHNAWVVGTEPVVAVDFTGLKDYAKSK
jgi:quercetin dioxygenase-like cupin family protein